MLKYFNIFLFFIALCASSPLENRVVNGKDANEGEFPFMVSLRINKVKHYCGATIINEKWILTAAHCVVERSPAAISIQYGVTDISKVDENVAEVAEIIVHEDFDQENSFINDIAVLRLSSAMEFSRTVQPVKIPQTFSEVPGHTTVTLTGWGHEKSGGKTQKHLQKADLITFSNDECSSKHFAPIYSTNICAGVPEGGKGQCSGDSGGPIILDGVQLGIVSWSIKPCTIAPYPGVYTKVSHYSDWIRNKTEIL